jgi:(2Fe-2S) ferredoxin
MSRYQRHIFVCLNERPPEDARGSCAAKGSAAVRDRFREELKKRGLASRVRTNNAGCLDACAHGTTVVIYPDAVWYGAVKPEDVEEIIDRTVLHGEVIQRLLIPDRRYAPERLQFPRLDPPLPE